MAINLNLEEYGRFVFTPPNGSPIDLARIEKNGFAVDKAVPVTTAKSNPVQLKPTRVVKNLLPTPVAKTERGVTVTPVNGGFRITGTATADIMMELCIFQLRAGTYTCQLNPSAGLPSTGGNIQITASGLATSFVFNGALNQIITRTVTEDSEATFKIRLVNGDTYDITLYPMLSVGSTAQPFYPYFAPSTVLPSLKAFGATPVKHKADKLWGQFVPTEYIGFDGSSYLDLAPLTTESDIEITFRRQDGYTQTNFLFGTNPDTPTSRVVGAWYGSAGFTVQNGSERRNVSLDTNWHTLKITSTKTYLDGVELADAGTRTSFQTLIIGSAKGQSGGAVDSRGFRGDISRVKVGNKIFVACKDVTANTFGLLDLATNTFYGNSGTGAFTGGSLIQPIAYAESTGTQYFDLEHTFEDSTKIEFTVTKTAPNQGYTDAESRGNVWFGCNGSTATELMLGWGTAGNQNYFRGLGSGVFNGWKPSLNTKYHIEFTYEKGNGQFYVDGEKKGNTVTTTNSTDGRSILIGAVRDQNAQAIIYCKQKFHNEVKMWDGDTLLAHYLPVRIGTTVELLDLVSWSFATRTGTFTAGADIPYTQLCPDIIKVNTGDLAYGQWGKNLFDGGERGTYVSTSGAKVANDGKYRSKNKIPVVAGQTYINNIINKPSWATFQTLNIFGYDAQGVFIWSGTSSVDAWGIGRTFTMPENTAYITISTFGTVVNTDERVAELNGKFMIVEGSTAPTEYEPYHFGIHTDGSHKLTVGSQGAVDLGTLSLVKHSTHGIWNVSSIPNAQRANGVTNLLMVGTNYSLTDVQSISGMADMTYKGHPNDRTFYIRDDYAYDNMTEAEFKAAMSGKYLFYQRTDDPTFIPPVSRDIPTLYSADSFVDTQLDSNNKSEAWGVAVFTGADSEGWALYEYQGAISFYKTVSDMIETSASTPGSNFLCTALDYNGSVWVENKVGFAVSTLKRLFFRPAGIETLADFKAWLAEKCPIFWYPVATPAITTEAIAPVELTEKATYTVTAQAELPVTQQATYLGVGV